MLTFSLLSALLYRFGGKEGYHTTLRDVGVPCVLLLAMRQLGMWHWSLIPSALLLFASLTTYWKKKGTDAMWWNWLLTGLGYSLSLLPYVICTGIWINFLIRTLVLTTLVTLWSELIGDVDIEEGGRGFFVIYTLTLLR